MPRGDGQKPGLRRVIKNNTCAAPNLERHGAHGRPRGRNTRPRVHSLEGIATRADKRESVFKPDSGFTKPGSRNPRKLARS